MAAAGSKEAWKHGEMLKALKEQKEALWQRLAQRLAEVSAKRSDQQIEVGEEESRVEITMDTSEMDCSTVVEQGKLPAAVQPVEDQVYNRLVSLEMNESSGDTRRCPI